MRPARYFFVIAVALTGCGGGDSDQAPTGADLERDLARAVERQTGTRDVQVECPEGAEGRDVCTATAPGGLQAKVTADGKIVEP